MCIRMQNVLFHGELNRYLTVLITIMQNVSFPPSDTIRMAFCFLTTRKQNVLVLSADTKNKYYLVSIFNFITICLTWSSAFLRKLSYRMKYLHLMQNNAIYPTYFRLPDIAKS